MLDKSLPYYNIIMKRYAGTKIPENVLDDGFTFVDFATGDERDWAEIMVSVGEFDSYSEAAEYFASEYLPYLDEVKRRMIFIKTKDGEKIGTLTVWWRYTDERRDPTMEWVAVDPNFQGKGLGFALIIEGMKKMIRIEGDRDFFLHTQTWSHKAVALYLKAGYVISENETFSDYSNDYEEAIEVLKGLKVI